MIINLVSNLDETSKIGELYNFNHVVAWSLREGFAEHGVETHLIKDVTMQKGGLPKADHSIVISVIGMKLFRDNEICRRHLRDASTGKTAVYLDADFSKWNKIFDYVFTLATLTKAKRGYVYAGWGANPEFFYPEQSEKAVYVDSLMYGKYEDKFNHIYDIYSEMMAETDLTIYFPIPVYNKRYNLIYWPELQKIIRKCNYYCCTQLGDGGLTRIEAATCGALLVVPKEFYRPKTMATLEHKIWETKEELMDILSTETNVQSIRKKALEHTWGKVAGRMLDALER